MKKLRMSKEEIRLREQSKELGLDCFAIDDYLKKGIKKNNTKK